MKGAFSMHTPFVQESRQMAHLAVTRAFLQAIAIAAMYYQAEGCTHPPPSFLAFVLAWNLSSKEIVPTDTRMGKKDIY